MSEKRGASTSSLLLLTVALSAVGCGKSATPSSLHDRSVKEWTFVRAPLTVLTPDFVQSTGFVRDHKRLEDAAFGYIETQTFHALSKSTQDAVKVVDEDAFARGALDPFSLQPIAIPKDVTLDENFEDYHTYESLTEELKRIAAAYPTIAKLESAGKSVQGRELWYIRLSDNVEAEEGEPKLLYISSMHGDEVTGKEMMIYLLRKLTKGYGSDDRITRLVDHSNLFIMPLMNPDGNAKRRRFNAHGEDLNRNFPDFTSDTQENFDQREPEVQAIIRLHNAHHFVSSLNFHGGEVCFNLPWDTRPNRPSTERFGDDRLLNTLGREYTKLNQPMFQNHRATFDHGLTYGYEWYEVDGGMQDWSIVYRSSMHATVELSMDKWPDASRLPSYWRDNEASLTKYLESSLHGIHLNVTSADGEPVKNVEVTIDTANRAIRYKGGLIHRTTITGPQKVTIKAEGYKEQTLTTDARTFDGTYENVVLEAL